MVINFIIFLYTIEQSMLKQFCEKKPLTNANYTQTRNNNLCHTKYWPVCRTHYNGRSGTKTTSVILNFGTIPIDFNQANTTLPRTLIRKEKLLFTKLKCYVKSIITFLKRIPKVEFVTSINSFNNINRNHLNSAIIFIKKSNQTLYVPTTILIIYVMDTFNIHFEIKFECVYIYIYI